MAAIYCLSAAAGAYDTVLVQDRFPEWLLDVAVPAALHKCEMTRAEQNALQPKAHPIRKVRLGWTASLVATMVMFSVIFAAAGWPLYTWTIYLLRGKGPLLNISLAAVAFGLVLLAAYVASRLAWPYIRWKSVDE